MHKHGRRTHHVRSATVLGNRGPASPQGLGGTKEANEAAGATLNNFQERGVSRASYKVYAESLQLEGIGQRL